MQVEPPFEHFNNTPRTICVQYLRILAVLEKIWRRSCKNKPFIAFFYFQSPAKMPEDEVSL